MADLYNNAIEVSPLYDSLSEGPKPQPFVFTLENCPSGFAKHNHIQAPQIAINGAGNGQVLEFRIPRYGLASIMYLHVEPTVSGSTNFGAKGILPLIKDSVQLLAGANLLQSVYMDSVYYRMCSMDYNDMISSFNNVGIVSVGGGVQGATGALDYYIPLYFAFSERPENFVDVAFAQELTIRLEIAPFSDCTSSGTSLTSLKINLEIQSTIPEPKAYNELKDIQFKGKEAHPFLWCNEYREPLAFATGASGLAVFDSVLLKANKFCSHSIIEVVSSTNNVPVKNSLSQVLSKVVLTSMNSELMTSNTSKSSIMEKRVWNNFRLAKGANAVILRYDLSGSYVRPESGLCLKNLNTPMLRVEAVVGDTNQYALKITHHFWNYVTIANDGTVARGLDN